MEFLKKMKSRETIEMVLKTISALVLGLILIILMEGMIFGIYMKKINENDATQYTVSQCIAYCEEVGEDKYKVYLENTETGSFSVKITQDSREKIETDGYIDVIWRAPNVFEVSINYVHYIVMGVFLAIILAIYIWRFYKLYQEYKVFERKFIRTGKIFA